MIDQDLSNYTLSELNKMSLDIAQDTLDKFPDSWKSVLGRHDTYKAICKEIKLKKLCRS